MKTNDLGRFTVQTSSEVQFTHERGFQASLDIRCTTCGRASDPAECFTLADLITWYWQHACAPMGLT